MVRPCLAVIDPLFNSLVFFPCVVAREGFHPREVWISIEDLVLLLKNLKCLLGGFVFVGGRLDLVEECLFSDDGFMLFNDICMPCRQTLI